MNLDQCNTSSPFTQFETIAIEEWLGQSKADGMSLDLALRGLGVSARPTSHNLNRADVAVAQLALHAVRHRLPGSGAAVNMGDRWAARSQRQSWGNSLALLPWHLLTVGWTCNVRRRFDTEAYYLAWLPHYDRYVVTASRDTDECWGYYDAALGDFGSDADPMDALGCIVGDWWNLQADRYRRAKWRYMVHSGLITAKLALEWANSVWCSEDLHRNHAK